jgi:hypothetical protein
MGTTRERRGIDSAYCLSFDAFGRNLFLGGYGICMIGLTSTYP